jgi:ketosteroid isomerase-like protein
MTTSKILCVSLAMLLAGSMAACDKAEPAKTAADPGKVAAAVKADVDLLVAEFNMHDAAKAVAHDAPGMVGMFHGTPNVVGPDQDLAQTKQQVADPLAKITVSNETVDVATSGDMAVYRATYAYVSTDPKTKQPTTENGNWVVGYKTQPDGSWKVAWNVVSDTGPAPAAAAGQ